MFKRILLCSAGIAAIAFGLLRYQQKRGRHFSDRSQPREIDIDEFYFDQPDQGLEIIRFQPLIANARTIH